MDRAELLAEAQRRGLVPPSQPSRDDLIAEAQRRGLIQEPEQSNMNKGEAIQKGMGIVKDWWQGNAEFEDAPDTADYFRMLKAKESKNDPVQAMKNLDIRADIEQTGVAVFGNDKDTKNYLLKKNPGIEFFNDANGNEMFKGEDGIDYYVNKPGVDATQTAKMVGQGLLYGKGGAPKVGGGLAKQTLAMGGSQGLANVAHQQLSGRGDIDVGEVGTVTGTGMLTKLFPGLVNKVRNASAGANQLKGDKLKALEFAKKNNLNLGYDDLAENAFVRTAGQQIDNIPMVGGGKFREAQNLQQKAIAKKITDKYILPNSDIDDLHEVVSGGMKSHMERSKKIASAKYEKVYKKLDESVGNFNIDSVKAKAQDIIENEVKKGSGANKEIINEMQTYLDIPEGNFSHWAEIRSDLTSKTRDLKNTLSGKKTKLAGALKQVNKELNKSMDDVVTTSTNPQLQQKWRDANSFYENAVKRYSSGALKQAVKNDNPETVLNILMRKGGADATDSTFKANALFNGLDKNGKQAVRHGMMERAYKEALDGGDFSPAKYATMLENYSNRLGVVLPKEDKKIIDGLTAYMRVTQQAGNFGRNTPTGQQAVPLLYTGAALGGAVADMGTTATAIIGIQGFKKLTRTPRGRSFMLALSKYPEGKKPPPELLTSIARYLAVKPKEDN